MSDPQFTNIATTAQVPAGYTLSFSNKQGATECGTYLGLYTMKTFDTIKCQQVKTIHPELT